MPGRLHSFLYRNINYIVDIVFISITFMFINDIEKLKLQYFSNMYNYYLFCYILGFITYGLIFEIISCLILLRYPSYYSIKKIFSDLLSTLVHPGPNPNSNFS